MDTLHLIYHTDTLHVKHRCRVWGLLEDPPTEGLSLHDEGREGAQECLPMCSERDVGAHTLRPSGSLPQRRSFVEYFTAFTCDLPVPGIYHGIFWEHHARDSRCTPPDPAGVFSEGAEVIQLRIEGSLTIPTTGIKRV